jgi:hypothetical protein
MHKRGDLSVHLERKKWRQVQFVQGASYAHLNVGIYRKGPKKVAVYHVPYYD